MKDKNDDMPPDPLGHPEDVLVARRSRPASIVARSSCAAP